MGWIYYLPEILFCISALGAVIWILRLFSPFRETQTGKIRCSHCQAMAGKASGHPCLFLLPVSFGETYEDAEAYLPAHMEPISGTDKIPTGRRACRTEVYCCPDCGTRQVVITDFLLVRGREYEKGTYQLPYQPFRAIIEKWDELSQRRNSF